MDYEIPYSTVAQLWPFGMTPRDFNDDRQSTHERTLRGGRTLRLFHSYVSLSFYCRFTLIFSHARHIETIDVRWCLSCLHGLALRSPGSWLGGSRVSALRLFCLAPVGSSVMLMACPSVASMDDLLRTGHTSCLVATFLVYHTMLSFHGLVGCFLFRVLCFVCLFFAVWVCLFLVFLWNDITRLRTTNTGSCHSIGFTCNN